MMLSAVSTTLRLQTTPAKLEADRTPGQLEIDQPPAELSIEQPAATLTIHKENGHVELDSRDAWEGLGIFSPFRLTEQVAEQAHQLVLEGIGKTAEDGDQLAQFWNHRNAVADLARRSQEPLTPIEYYGGVSYSPVHEIYHPTVLDIQWEPHKAKIEVTQHAPNIQYQPSVLQIYLSQKNSLSIDVVGQHVDQTS